jgi:hypothetical protein
MVEADALAEKIRAAGFACLRCGSCCKTGAGDSGLVMVSANEIRAIASWSGYSWEDIAEPYPEVITGERGETFTIGWVLRRQNGRCRFSLMDKCEIYETRPWICRTFPFLLDGDKLAVFHCPGVGTTIAPDDARALAQDLIRRKISEEQESEKVKQCIGRCKIPSGSFIVIDADGMKIRDKECYRLV